MYNDIQLNITSLAANERGREDAEDVVLVEGTTRNGGGHVAAVVGEGKARNSHSVMLVSFDISAEHVL